MITLHSAADHAKLQRIDIRTTSKVKRTLTHAAELSGLSMSAFLLAAALEKANDLLKQQEILVLSDNERDRFLTLLEHPGKPVKKLVLAMKKYIRKRK